MACITKLANAIVYDCDTGTTGLDSAIIINKADIVSFVVDSGVTVNSLVLAPGAKPYKIDTVKRSLTVASALKVNDGAPNAYAHTATLVITGTAVDRNVVRLSNALANGSFVIIASRSSTSVVKQNLIYGLYYGMSATAHDRHSHDNGGWGYATLSTPENVIGEDNLLVTVEVFNSLYAAAV